MHLVLGNLQQAEQDFQDALHGNPTHAHYPHYRAVVHGRKARARPFSEPSRRDPLLPLSQAARTWRACGARGALRHVCTALLPQFPPVQGELKDAVKWNQAALTLNPNYFPALYHLGLCLYLQASARGMRRPHPPSRVAHAAPQPPRALAAANAVRPLLEFPALPAEPQRRGHPAPGRRPGAAAQELGRHGGAGTRAAGAPALRHPGGRPWCCLVHQTEQGAWLLVVVVVVVVVAWHS